MGERMAEIQGENALDARREIARQACISFADAIAFTTDDAKGEESKMERELIASKSLNQWNYKETITSTFEWETLKCNRCTRSQQCSKTKKPLFGDAYCKTWADPKESCTETQF